MALRSASLTFLLLLALLSPSLAFSASQFVNGRVTCSDCPNDFDFSGIKIVTSCENTRKRLTVTTNKKGDFTTELPSTTPSNCVVEILGGPTQQLYASRKNMKAKVVKPHGRYSKRYALAKPLIFSTSPPPSSSLGSSKTIDLPLPPEWGLAPTSYYFPPFFPIIGIP